MNVSYRRADLTVRPTEGRPKQAIALAYPMQEIAAQIFSRPGAHPVRHIMLAGATRKVGTSFVANGLADTLSASGQRVLIIQLVVDRTDGMTLPRLLATPEMDAPEQKTTLQVGADEIVALVAPGSLAFEQVSMAVTGRFDVVLWDLPPPGLDAPTAVASRLMDGVVLVVRTERTTRRALAYAAERLHANNARMLGVVMNRVRRSAPRWLDRLS